MDSKNFSNNNEMQIFLAYQTRNSQILYLFLSISTLGFINLFMFWKNKYRIHRYNKTNDLLKATEVIIHYKNSYSVKKLRRIYSSIHKFYLQEQITYFIFNKTRYYYNINENKFLIYPTLLEEFKKKPSLMDFYEDGLNETEAKNFGTFFGRNLIEIKIPKISKLLITEILSPFFLYQVACVIVWLLDEYEYYAFVIVLLSIISIYASIREIRQSAFKIKKLAFHEVMVTVSRQINDELQDLQISSLDLVPGDLIHIIPEQKIPCDIILKEGEVIVNEGMLTGETTPIKKTSFEPSSSIKNCNILYSGTDCMMSQGKNNYALGLVVATGFYTFKGELVKGILKQEVEEVRFNKESINYLKITFFITIIGVIWYFYYSLLVSEMEFSWFYLIIKALELFTNSIPPTLPLCLTLGLEYAVLNLRKKEIQTLILGKINLAGRVKVMCFDKTGTLTENNLIFYGFTYKEYTQQQERFIIMKEKINLDDNDQYLYMNSNFLQMYEAFACAHNLSFYGNHPVGDPLDLKMFEYTMCSLQEIVDENSKEVKKYIIPPQQFQKPLQNFYMKQYKENINFKFQILRVFDFSSERKRSSSIIYNELTQKYKIVVKGVPKLIAKLCQKDSIPYDFEEYLETYSQEGLRIIGVASKELQQEEINQSEEQLEIRLLFDGFIFFENSLKKETKNSILELKKAKIKNVMITGDNILTALNVANSSGIIQSQKNVWIGEINDEDQLQWDFLECQEQRDKRKQSLSFDHSHSIGSLSLNDRVSNLFDKVQILQNDNYTQEKLVHIIKRIQQKDCIIAMSGDCFELLYKNYQEENNSGLDIILKYTLVFGRANPDQKAMIVKAYKKLLSKKDDLFVGFCGDGANDCCALQAAHIGLSLSEMEASIASPFVSTIDNISTVVELLKEGKACLASGIQSFEFMSTSSMFEFFTILFLYYFDMDLSDGNYYLIDLLTLFPLSLLMVMSFANEKLTHKYPHSNIFNKELIVKTFGILLIYFLMNLITLIYYVNSPLNVDVISLTISDGLDVNRLNFLQRFGISSLCSFGILGIGIFFSQGYPFKREWYQQKIFLIFVILNFILQIIFTFGHGFGNGFLQGILNSIYYLLLIPEEDMKFFATLVPLSLLLMFCHYKYVVPICLQIYSKLELKRKNKSDYQRINQ